MLEVPAHSGAYARSSHHLLAATLQDAFLCRDTEWIFARLCCDSTDKHRRALDHTCKMVHLASPPKTLRFHHGGPACEQASSTQRGCEPELHVQLCVFMLVCLHLFMFACVSWIVSVLLNFLFCLICVCTHNFNIPISYVHAHVNMHHYMYIPCTLPTHIHTHEEHVSLYACTNARLLHACIHACILMTSIVCCDNKKQPYQPKYRDRYIHDQAHSRAHAFGTLIQKRVQRASNQEMSHSILAMLVPTNTGLAACRCVVYLAIEDRTQSQLNTSRGRSFCISEKCLHAATVYQSRNIKDAYSNWFWIDMCVCAFDLCDQQQSLM
jgi:hypothetical protein